MSVQLYRADLEQALTPQLGAGEAAAICRYVFEDYFGFKKNDPSATFHSFLIEDFNAIKNRLLTGEPVQYVVGFGWFYGLKFKVNNNVLIPRPETEELVEWVLNTAKTLPIKGLRILDIGTGSGCMPIIFKLKLPESTVTAIDISEGALITAGRNAFRHNVEIDFIKTDILNEADRSKLGTFDIIVSNPPYIPHREKSLMNNTILDYEPHQALFVADDDPLIFYKNIIQFAQKHLSTEGVLFFECNEFNARTVVDILHLHHFKNVDLQKDMSGKDRMIRAFTYQPA